MTDRVMNSAPTRATMKRLEQLLIRQGMPADKLEWCVFQPSERKTWTRDAIIPAPHHLEEMKGPDEFWVVFDGDVFSLPTVETGRILYGDDYAPAWFEDEDDDQWGDDD